MGLREQDAENLRDVLFQEDDLGEWHMIDGKRMLVLLDNDALRSRQDLGGIVGLDKGFILYFARASEFERRPQTGNVQMFDGKAMKVMTCNEDFGMLEVTLSQVRQGGL